MEIACKHEKSVVVCYVQPLLTKVIIIITTGTNVVKFLLKRCMKKFEIIVLEKGENSYLMLGR